MAVNLWSTSYRCLRLIIATAALTVATAALQKLWCRCNLAYGNEHYVFLWINC